MRNKLPVLLAILLAACAAERASVPIPDTVIVPAGSFIYGSDRAEREAAYRLDERAYGHSVTRRGRWYESEPKRGKTELPGFRITRTVITNRQYTAIAAATGRAGCIAPGLEELSPEPSVFPHQAACLGWRHPARRKGTPSGRSGVAQGRTRLCEMAR